MKWQDLATLAGVALGVVALPATFLAGRRSRQRPTLRYAIDHDVLVEPKDGLLAEGLSLRFKDEEIERVSRTYVAIWNDRGDTIPNADIVANDPLRLQLPMGDVALQARVRFRSRQQNAVSATLADQRDIIGFDYMDQGDGVVIEVLHGGRSLNRIAREVAAQLREKPRFEGTIRGTTIRSAQQDALLTPTHLQALATVQGWLRKRLPPIMRAIVFCALLGFVIGALYATTWGTPDTDLVDATRYDLSTVEGQDRFSQAVEQERSDVSWSDPELYVPALIAGIVIGAGYLGFMRRWRRTMPRSILADEVKPGE